ncbi:Hypothetical protein FKW44_014690 [Caligus rogercresseyi]|uniref:Uncharacterized protein n=1 Tax=Caligus rogercresseyi TaxID=217165 RepID=A0A7T8H045_CALRO|nr:Hypothetical protein FKW44_014690 [Caligus rogercresseyi]
MKKKEKIETGQNTIILSTKLPDLKRKRDNLVRTDDGQRRLYGAVLDEVIDTLEQWFPKWGARALGERRAIAGGGGAGKTNE